jgi:hypothetical protein
MKSKTSNNIFSRTNNDRQMDSERCLFVIVFCFLGLNEQKNRETFSFLFLVQNINIKKNKIFMLTDNDVADDDADAAVEVEDNWMGVLGWREWFPF